jgi:hypothetical protein
MMTLPTMAGLVSARIFRFLVGSVARCRIAPLGKVWMGKLVSALIRVKELTN